MAEYVFFCHNCHTKCEQDIGVLKVGGAYVNVWCENPSCGLVDDENMMYGSLSYAIQEWVVIGEDYLNSFSYGVHGDLILPDDEEKETPNEQ